MTRLLLKEPARIVAAVWLATAIALSACANPVADRSSSPTDSPARGPKRVGVAMNAEATSMVGRMNFAQISIPGASTLEMLVNGSMTEQDVGGNTLPLFAQAVPTQENGLWQLLPDGGMTTTWKLRPGIFWHDGTPLTAQDFVFAFNVDRDKDIPTRRPLSYEYIDRASAPDAETVTLTWKRVYVAADRAFTAGSLTPIPRHLLETTFDADRVAFLNLPYWSHGYVGTGAFKLSQFNLGSSIVLAANDAYVHGRPKIDEIEVRFLPDINVLVTNLMAGSVDMSMGRGFAIEQALRLREQWPQGSVSWIQSFWVVIFPQFVNPTNPIVLSLPFRQALMYGTDRQQLLDALVAGLSTVADMYISPSEPEYKDVLDAAVKYPYDPRRAAQLIEGLGYSKGSDGIYQSAAGERLAVHVRSNGEPITQSGVIPLANMWSQLGVATEPEVIATQRLTDREYLATYPNFRMMRQPSTAMSLSSLHSINIPLPENRFVGSNYGRYTTPELDAIVDRSLSAVAPPDRIKAYRDGVAHISRNLNHLGMFYDLAFVAVSNRLQNIGADETRFWTIHQWDVK